MRGSVAKLWLDTRRKVSLWKKWGSSISSDTTYESSVANAAPKTPLPMMAMNRKSNATFENAEASTAAVTWRGLPSTATSMAIRPDKMHSEEP